MSRSAVMLAEEYRKIAPYDVRRDPPPYVVPPPCGCIWKLARQAARTIHGNRIPTVVRHWFIRIGLA
ncbi:MAG: hypothetical protein SGJ20_19570, partial [Planctomycetota bacterium]|nr:hypothetical protein [Planctomycetota bacterium]